MATVQLQKTVHTAAITKTAIDQKQSLEVVQTMIHGTLSQLAYLRAFFREEAFDLETYTPSEKIQPYDDYAAGRPVKKAPTAAGPGTRIKVMRRNRSMRCDVFLDWLEIAVFGALKAGTLRALQINVHLDPQDRSKVVECYTLTVEYLTREDGSEVLSGLRMDSPKDSLVSTASTSSALQVLLKDVIELCGRLPKLPDAKFTSMELFFRNDVPEPAIPKGWIPSSGDKLMFGECEGWAKQTEELEELQSGFHGTSIKISHLKQTSTIDAIDPARPISHTRIPKALQYGKNYSKRDEIAVLNSKSKNGGKQASITPVTTSDAPKSRVRSPENDTAHELERAPFDTSQMEDSLNTQSSNIPNMKAALKGMLQSEHLTQGDTQTQGLEHPPRSAWKTNKSSTDTRPVLSQATAKYLEHAKQHLRSAARRLAKPAGKKQKNAELILCQCDSYKEDGDMVSCMNCDTWQHLSCYGYTGESDPRLPENHVCYKCLLGDTEEDTLARLTELAKKRRGMHFTLQNGFKIQREFTSETGLPSSVFVPLMQCLKGQGYIVAAKNSHKAGYAASGKPKLVAVKEGPGHEKMLKDLFDPMMHIGHHYELPSKAVVPAEVLTKQLLAGEKDDMPPPATPASKPTQATQTPDTDLDLRASMTPFKTPTRPWSGDVQVRNGKRGRDENEDTTRPPKRPSPPYPRAQHRNSAQTPFLLDINGNAASPAFIGPTSRAP